ncbi:hypothetical protein LJC49_10845, partial [Ruminococcaceae bacterium OttesenSCG-928-I18]|nr:hypothetical protein [Ruminococcaceae bacterium OttesenSCG-928-I18]
MVKIKLRIASVLVVLFLVVGLGPVQALAAPAPAIGNIICFGEHYGGPIIWLVTDNNGGMRSRGGLYQRSYDDDPSVAIQPPPDTRLLDFSNSSLSIDLNGTFRTTAFSPAEQLAITGNIGIPTSNQGALVSYGANVYYWIEGAFIDGGNWQANYVDGVGDLHEDLVNNGSYFVVPTLQLDLSRVLFTTDATGGKPTSPGQALSPMQTTTNALKLTVLDNTLSCSAEVTNVSGKDITFSYEIAGTCNRLAAIVQGENGD